MKKFDAFISHASEDKDSIVRVLAALLKKEGFNIWYDEFTLSVGSSLRRSIDKGIVDSRFGIVVLSRAFFDKEWTNYELDGLNSINIENPGTILPIWYGISKKDAMLYSPSMANTLALQTDGNNIKEIVVKLKEKLGINEYSITNSGIIRKNSNNVPIPRDVRLQGFQAIFSNQVDRIVNKKESQSKSDIVLAPINFEFNSYPFHYWQNEKGNIQLTHHEIYEVDSGNIIKSTNTIHQNDGNKLFAELSFTLPSLSPVRIIGEVTTTNQLNGLYNDGLEYVEFNNKRRINLFSYTLIIPNSKDYKQFEVFANEEKINPQITDFEIIYNHKYRTIKPNTKLKYTILNKAKMK